MKSQIVFCQEKLKNAFLSLKNSKLHEERQIYRWLERAFVDLEENAFCGIQIPKKLIPASYIQKYEIDNLWKYNLPNAWRLTYSIKGSEIKVVSIVVEWMSHKEYEKRFGY
ncbi:MAG: hypothetical protein KAR87_04190 [Candidatus Aenigmarchaeota archaeon]|nr:hypothetical protein [Candidatus Aenigmarchaeota archaeon]